MRAVATARRRTADAVASARRTGRLLALPAGAAGDAVEGAVRRAAGQDPEAVRRRLRQRGAARTTRVLGGLRGGAVKAGQLLSTVEALLPADPEATWRQALTGLQSDVRALPFAEVEPALVAALGREWSRQLPQLDRTASAAASLGQVHRGRWHDGREVAVKLQYPGVAAALRSDVAVLSALTRAASLVARGLTAPPLVRELRDRLLEELDYAREARVQRAFAAAFADDPDVRVPEVVFDGPGVLVTEWLDGRPLSQVAAEDDEPLRQAAAERYQRFLVSGPERAGWLHTDPHPGNFLLLPDGRLGVLDFGSALPLPGGMPPAFGRLIGALTGEDADEVGRRLRDGGFVRPGRSIDVERLTGWMAPFSEPARHERFRFSRDWLRAHFGRADDPRDPDFAAALALDLPAEHLFTQRVWLGMVGVLCSLEAEVPVRPVLTRWLPGFAPVSGATAAPPPAAG